MAAHFDVAGFLRGQEGLSVMIAANLFDGFHATAVAGANVVYQLLRNPESLTQAKADPRLASEVVAEGLRLSPPLTMTERWALHDLEFAHISISRGMAIGMLWAAGNPDPAIYDDPNRYELVRKRRIETTFGGGAHICPGRHVSRMLLQTTLERLLLPDISMELAAEPIAWWKRFSVRQLSRLPLVMSRA
jgi:cytochrome P450